MELDPPHKKIIPISQQWIKKYGIVYFVLVLFAYLLTYLLNPSKEFSPLTFLFAGIILLSIGLFYLISLYRSNSYVTENLYWELLHQHGNQNFIITSKILSTLQYSLLLILGFIFLTFAIIIWLG